MDARRERGQEWTAGPPSAAGTGSAPPPSRQWIRRQLARRGAPLPPPSASLEEHLRYHERYTAAECSPQLPGPGPPPPLDAARVLPLLSLFSGDQLRALLTRFCDQHELLIRCCGHSPRQLRAELAHALAERVSRVSDTELSAATGALPPLWHTRLFWQKLLVLRWLGIDGSAAPVRQFLRSERHEACAAAGPVRSRSGELPPALHRSRHELDQPMELNGLPCPPPIHWPPLVHGIGNTPAAAAGLLHKPTTVLLAPPRISVNSPSSPFQPTLLERSSPSAAPPRPGAHVPSEVAPSSTPYVPFAAAKSSAPHVQFAAVKPWPPKIARLESQTTAQHTSANVSAAQQTHSRLVSKVQSAQETSPLVGSPSSVQQTSSPLVASLSSAQQRSTPLVGSPSEAQQTSPMVASPSAAQQTSPMVASLSAAQQTSPLVASLAAAQQTSSPLVSNKPTAQQICFRLITNTSAGQQTSPSVGSKSAQQTPSLVSNVSIGQQTSSPLVASKSAQQTSPLMSNISVGQQTSSPLVATKSAQQTTPLISSVPAAQQTSSPLVASKSAQRTPSLVSNVSTGQQTSFSSIASKSTQQTPPSVNNVSAAQQTSSSLVASKSAQQTPPLVSNIPAGQQTSSPSVLSAAQQTSSLAPTVFINQQTDAQQVSRRPGFTQSPGESQETEEQPREHRRCECGRRARQQRKHRATRKGAEQPKNKTIKETGSHEETTKGKCTCGRKVGETSHSRHNRRMAQVTSDAGSPEAEDIQNSNRILHLTTYRDSSGVPESADCSWLLRPDRASCAGQGRGRTEPSVSVPAASSRDTLTELYGRLQQALTFADHSTLSSGGNRARNDAANQEWNQMSAKQSYVTSHNNHSMSDEGGPAQHRGQDRSPEVPSSALVRSDSVSSPRPELTATNDGKQKEKLAKTWLDDRLCVRVSNQPASQQPSDQPETATASSRWSEDQSTGMHAEQGTEQMQADAIDQTRETPEQVIWMAECPSAALQRCMEIAERAERRYWELVQQGRRAGETDRSDEAPTAVQLPPVPLSSSGGEVNGQGSTPSGPAANGVIRSRVMPATGRPLSLPQLRPRQHSTAADTALPLRCPCCGRSPPPTAASSQTSGTGQSQQDPGVGLSQLPSQLAATLSQSQAAPDPLWPAAVESEPQQSGITSPSYFSEQLAQHSATQPGAYHPMAASTPLRRNVTDLPSPTKEDLGHPSRAQSSPVLKSQHHRLQFPITAPDEEASVSPETVQSGQSISRLPSLGPCNVLSSDTIPKMETNMTIAGKNTAKMETNLLERGSKTAIMDTENVQTAAGAVHEENDSVPASDPRSDVGVPLEFTTALRLDDTQQADLSLSTYASAEDMPTVADSASTDTCQVKVCDKIARI